MRLVPHRGMYVVFRAGGLRLGIPATSIHEVQSLDQLSEQDLAVLPEQDDLAALFGLSPERNARVALIIDMRPARMLRVSAVEAVVDLSGAPFFALPDRIRLAAQGAVRGARLHRGELLLELAPEALVTLVREQISTLPAPSFPRPLAAPPDRALIFAAGGRRLAAALSDVIQVVTAPAVCPVPLLPDHLWGILHHERTLHVVADAAALFGVRSERPPPLAILLDVPGVPLAIAASRVEGIRDGLQLAPEGVVPGAWLLADREGVVHLPVYDGLVEHV